MASTTTLQHDLAQRAPHACCPRGLPALIRRTRAAPVNDLHRRRGAAVARAALPELLGGGDALHAAATALLHHAPLAYEPVAAPCSLMNCGDVIHRSTLDPVLRKEVGGPSWQIFALLAAAGVYLSATPGVLSGAYDYYIGAALQRKKQRAIDKSDLALGKKLGSGAFGSVFKAQLAPEQEGEEAEPVIVKKAKEFGEAEVWMNERMARASPNVIAGFVTAFEGTEEPAAAAKKKKGAAAAAAAAAAGPLAGLLGKKGKEKAAEPLDPGVWLVWRDEGDYTLWDLMQAKGQPGFPYNLEPLLLGRELRLPKGQERRAVTIKVAFRQMLEALRDCHAVGIVHRDFKPQNTIVSVSSRRLKLIDFGAAADLLVGINYVPNEYLLDPRYAPPQQYIMSRQTPRPPPKPVAALLSPVLWAMERPDKFDMYSAGITLLQLAFPGLRSDNGIIAFNRKLKDCGHDLNKWRANEAMSKRNNQWPKELEEGFELLDADGGQGWDLACKLVAYDPSARLSAAAALRHPWLASAPADAPAAATALARAGAVADSLTASVGSALSTAAETVGTAGGTISRSIDELLPAGLVEEALTASNKGALTEAYLLQEFGGEKAAPAPPREARQTIVWWEGREKEMQKRIGERRGGGGTGVVGRSPGGTRAAAAKNGGGAAAAGAPAAAKGGAAANGNGRAARNGNGNGKASRPASPSVVATEDPVGGADSDDDAASVGQTPPATAGGAASRVRELLNVFGKR